MPETATVRNAGVASASLHYERRGAGPPLVLIHGLGGEWRAWMPVLDALAARRDVIALDLPGFGDSPPLGPEEDPSPPGLARAVTALLDGLGLDRPHVAGNSLGGWVALELARLGRSASVTALSPAGFWGHPLAPKERGRRAAQALLPILRRAVGHPLGRRIVLAASVARPERVPAEAARRMVTAYATAPGMKSVNAAMRGSWFDWPNELAVPVTLAWGDHDRLVRPPAPATVPAGARTRTLRGCGHVPMWDDPAQVTEVVLAGSSS